MMVPKERPVLPREHVFRLMPPHEGSSGLAQETLGTTVGRGSAIHDAGGRVKGLARTVRTQVSPDAPRNTSDLHSQGTGTQRVVTPKLLKVQCGGYTYSLRDETRRESGRSGQDVRGNEAEGMGAVRESSGGEPTPSEKKRERQRMVQEKVAEGTLCMKRMRGKSEVVMGGDGGDVGERASGKRPSKEEGETATEEGDGQKKPRRRKTADAASGGERPVGEECDEAAVFWLEYKRNDGGEIVKKELPVQLLIDPRKVCDIPPWERYYNHRSLNRETVDDIKAVMPVTRRPEKADRVHKDVFKPEDKDKYYYYPVNGQHTVAAVKELEGEPIFDLWKMHSWPARVVSFSDRDFAGYRQCLADMTDVEKLSILDNILALRGVFVQSAGGHLKRQHKAGIKDMVATRKVDRVMLRMFHYILFLETEEHECVWRYRSPFFRTEERLLEESGPQGLTKQMWVEMRKHFQGKVEYVNTCKRTLPHEKESLDDAKRLYDDDRFPKSFEKSVRSILRRTEEEVRDTIRVSGDVRHIKWPDLNWVTSLIPFAFLASQAHNHVTAIHEVVRYYVCNLYVLDLCDPPLLTDWREDDFANARRMARHSVHHVKTGKWVRNAQKQATVRESNMLVEECNRLYVIFNGEKLVRLTLNTVDGETWCSVYSMGTTMHPRESVSHFLRRLEHVYFTLAEPLTVENYKSQFDEEDPFDAEDMEELSDSETFDFESMPPPRVVGQVGDEEEGGPRRYSMSPAGLKRVFWGEPLDDQSSNDGDEERDYDHEPCDRLPEDHDTWQNDRLYFFGKHHQFTAEDMRGYNVVWHPRIFQPAVKNGMWVMAMKEADGKWSGLKRLGAGAFKGTARHALVEHLSLMNPERNDPDVVAYAEHKLNELYANNMLQFRAPFYTIETTPSRGIDWRMPQPPSGGQHPGGGGGGDEEDGGGGGGDSSQFVGKGTGETSSVEKASDGKGSGRKDSGGKGLGGKGLGGKESGGKGSRGKGLGNEHVRELAVSRRLEGPAAGVLETGGGEYERHTPGEEERSPETRAVHQEEETQRWQSRKVLVTGGSKCERHASEGASVDTDSESAGAPGETHALQRGEESRRMPAQEDVKGLYARAMVIGTSEEVLHSRSVVATTREGVVKGGQWTFVQAPVLGDDEDEKEPAVEAWVHGHEKGGEPVVEGGEVTVGIQTDPQRKDGDSSPTRCGEEQGGRASVLSTARGMVLHEAIELGDDSAATELVSDSGVAEMQNVESSVEGGEVAISIKMDLKRKDHDSPSTCCSAEQGDRASVLSTSREMVLHEAIDLPSDSAFTELVSDTAVAEVQNLESSVDVGAVARQAGEFP
ncbi:hypothetical protein CBR_g40957 [Chara braunii]|uniref:Uncharacterized protein n=1 Tax=Chara braunii TaxID=69332 RepID=A0A388LUR3_CHABU|nr:hypothetical protein CBR_g40957 [Chara braunii]|eukprot:GBG86056.1 hypothetical protein CBR_g40957 [Chara braunii]